MIYNASPREIFIKEGKKIIHIKDDSRNVESLLFLLLLYLNKKRNKNNIQNYGGQTKE